ncbi:MAG: phenylacetate--CoA ligase family protein [Oscillospiraceae bacterium]|nr:phenylacetate--CoA ligase family protein [Oscillospiraceae bacterium]
MKKTGIFKAMKLCMDYKKMDCEQREKLRADRMSTVVNHARKNSPYLKELYKDIPQDFSLSDLPVTDKKTLMENWDSWVCDRNLKLADVEKFMEDTSNIGNLYNKEYMVFTTSGSTGNPLVAVVDKNANNIMGGISACRSFARKQDLKAFIKKKGKTIGVFADGGFYLANSSVQNKLKTMPWKKKQIAVSSALYTIDTIVKQLNDFQPAMLGGYPSNLELLIDEAKEGRLDISPVLIMTGGEYLSDDLRRRLAETFNCYVQTSYSCTEGGTVACECTNQHFHINDDWLIVEPVDNDGNPVADGVLSDKIYLTNLYNYTQPFIRYEVSDRVIMHHEDCGCGNPSPWIELEGRTDDVTTFVEDGKTIKIPPLAVYATLKEIHSLRRFQVLVYDHNKIELRIDVKNADGRALAFEDAKSALKNYLAVQGVHNVSITLSDNLPQQNENSGKFKHIVNMQNI